MKHSLEIIGKVKMLRMKGSTYAGINRILKSNLPKSTLSYWCRDVKVPLAYHHKINSLNKKSLKKATRVALKINKEKRIKFLRNIIASNAFIDKKIKDKQVLKLLLAILYLGQGSKWKSHRGLQLGSSDPNIIKLYLKLLDICYDIKPKVMGCWISYRADQDINKLKMHWASITKIPFKNFYRSNPDPRTVGKPTLKRDYKGVCVISCGGTRIQLELEAIPLLILKGL